MDATGVAVNSRRGAAGNKAQFRETDGDSLRYPGMPM
jgi:hypothetical protein